VLRDISVTVRDGGPVWPGDTVPSCKWTWSIAQGSSVNVSTLTTSPHAGTHADAPLHVRDGWPGSHELPLEAFCGEAVVVDLSLAEGEIGETGLGGLLPDGEIVRLLLRTGRTVAAGSFPHDWPALSEGCARMLLGRGLRLLGVDAPSVDLEASKQLAVHKMLFAGGANVLENLDLRRVPDGRYELLAFPLKVMALDAAPVRAVLRDLSAASGHRPSPST
jgi:arylformamidase